MEALESILNQKVIAILRHVPLTKLETVVTALVEGGIRLVEVTMNSKDAIRSIELLSEKFRDRILTGAGTVLTTRETKDAIAAGARFIISPATDKDVIKVTRDHGAVSLPGAFTATEIINAERAGGQLIKIFPAQDPVYIKGILAALDKIKLMPTGGVNIENIKQFFEAGASAAGVGSALVRNEELTQADYAGILSTRASRLLHALQPAEKILDA